MTNSAERFFPHIHPEEARGARAPLSWRYAGGGGSGAECGAGLGVGAPGLRVRGAVGVEGARVCEGSGA